IPQRRFCFLLQRAAASRQIESAQDFSRDIANLAAGRSLPDPASQRFRPAQYCATTQARFPRGEIRHFRNALLDACKHSPCIGRSRFFADQNLCRRFLLSNPQLTDLDLLSPAGRLLVRVSAAGRRAANAFPILTRIADSLWIEAQTSPSRG